jgi:protein-S-isoprenylcysteine O-methyltransferase Ste14
VRGNEKRVLAAALVAVGAALIVGGFVFIETASDAEYNSMGRVAVAVPIIFVGLALAAFGWPRMRRSDRDF